MRIVLDLQACQGANRERGIGRYALALARQLARRATTHGRDHQLHIVLNSRFPDSVEPLRQAFDGLVARQHITVFDIPAPAAAADPANAWRLRAAEQIREHYLTALRPDIVHVASLFEGWGDDAVASVRQAVPDAGAAAVTLYDLIPLMRPALYLGNPAIRDWYYRKLQSLKSADLLLAISGHSRDEAIGALHLPPERVINISSAIDPGFAPRPPDPDSAAALRQRFGLSRPFLMYTGGIDPRKNIEGLIEAFARLPGATRERHQLAIVCHAGAPDRQRLAALARRHGLRPDALVLTGFVPDDDLVALYNLASAFVFPSLHEGFGLPALEAMACGVPVIGSDASSIPEVIGRADALFDPADLAAMGQHIERVLTDEAWRAELRRHGLAQARLFSWDASAERALAGFEQLHQARTEARRAAQPLVSRGAQGRPRLAFLSPLPPDKSGIADYSAGLLPELAPHYDIDVVVQGAVSDPWVRANCRIRSIDWFERHADGFDRIVYHVGNSDFHSHMFSLLGRFPGVVVLHDFFLSGIINYLDHLGQQAGAMRQALYDSHGYRALIEEQHRGRLAAIWHYPCNRRVLDDAAGVIVHSDYARQLANAWYGPGAADDWVVMPFPRASAQGDRHAARQRLGLGDEEFLVCSFGLLGATKLNDQLLDAWLASPLAADPRCRLVFVGENDPGGYGDTLARAIARSGCAQRITITGFASPALYQDYLAGADCAVQLRGKSRGETSAAIMDCLAHGVPAIVNANGSAAELPDAVLLKIPDEFSPDQLREALVRLYREPAVARAYADQARAYLDARHHPHQAGLRYRDAIEHFCATSAAAGRRRLACGLGRLACTVAPASADWLDCARSIAANQAPPFGPRQLLVDVSELIQRDARSGIQRVVRNVLGALLREPPQGYRVEPVFDAGGQYRYARRFTCELLGVDDLALPDSLVEAGAGDRYLGLDLLPHAVPLNAALFAQLRNRGVELYFVVYDLLPVLRPDVFVPQADTTFRRWLATVTALADGVACISRAVADELAQWLEQNPPARAGALKINYFHLGADIGPARADGLAGDGPAHPALAAMDAAPGILMVGTLEPRKGHAQALGAFEQLWAAGCAANLVIVGKEGWMVESLAKRLRTHPEQGKRLHWLEGADDVLLRQLYGAAGALLAASEGEGFGLPLIEAAQHGLPIIARDLPVFAEVAGEHAFYFSGTSPDALAGRLREWLDLHARAKAPPSSGMRWLSWADSARQLLAVIDRPFYRAAPG
jgi:glycosyltransferase involved in cell wall biosynthesis